MIGLSTDWAKHVIETKSNTKQLTGKRFYKDRLMKTLERTFWEVNGVVKDWTEDMLRDALSFCEHYSNVKLRNVKFNEYVKDTKLSPPSLDQTGR